LYCNSPTNNDRMLHGYTLCLKKTSQPYQAVVSSSMGWFWLFSVNGINTLSKITLSLHFYLFCLLLNSYDGNDATPTNGSSASWGSISQNVITEHLLKLNRLFSEASALFRATNSLPKKHRT